MRLTVTKTGSAVTYYIIRSVNRNGKRSSEVVKRLGTEDEIRKMGVEDPASWAREQLEIMNREEQKTPEKAIYLHPDKRIEPDQQNQFNVGYLFLKQLYYGLRLPQICKKIADRSGFEYDLDEILSRLVYGRILYPGSKLSCFEQSRTLLEQPHFELHQVYRALSVLSREMDFIQAELYKNSLDILPRKTGVLYYDCTNYYFEIEDAEGLKQYGPSKEHRPNPIVEMGLFMDASGIPLAFCIHEGNKNEQVTLAPLEKQILSDFGHTKFVVCTDAGLASAANRKFNNIGERSFVTTQSVKTLSKDLKKWALDTDGWRLQGDNKVYSIADLADTEENRDKVFYKERLIDGWDDDRDVRFQQNLIVTFSLKFKLYQQSVRQRQIDRATAMINGADRHLDTTGMNDCKRFIRRTSVTENGEIAEKKIYSLNEEVIAKEAQYDGFYAVCTNLLDDVSTIIQVNRGRWEIEESFRIMKTEFSARPVYLKRDDRIRAHFLTCFISLLIYRLLEHHLPGHYTCSDIIQTLRQMNLTQIGKEGFIPSYTRTALTDALHDVAGFSTDFEFIPRTSANKLCVQARQLRK